MHAAISRAKRFSGLRKKQSGLTLLEVLVAVGILAVISTVSFQVISVVTLSSEASQESLKRLKRLDRTWIVIENDVRNILPIERTPPFGETIPSFTAGDGNEDYWMTLLRGGVANPLGLPRSEIQRVAYKLEDNVLSRYSWVDSYNLEEEDAFPQKLLDGVESIEMRVLLSNARSISAGPWDDSWPSSNTGSQATPVATNQLPLAIEITMTLDNEEELRRFLPLVRVPAVVATGGTDTGGANTDGANTGGVNRGRIGTNNTGNGGEG